MAIEKVEVTNGQLSVWGLEFGEYRVNGTQVDLQDLMVKVTERRAVAIENEVAPLSARVRKRNDNLDQLGKLLAELTRVQATFESDAKGDTVKDIDLSNMGAAITALELEGDTTFTPSLKKIQKQQVEKYIQLTKSKIDALNNRAQLDTSRMQSLVERRDEAFTTASDLMKNVSDTRGTLIRNLAS